MMDIATITSSIGSVVGLLKQIGEQVKKLQNKDLNLELIDLQQHTLSIQTGLSELAEENRSLRGKLEELRKFGETEKELVPDGEVYRRRRDGKSDGRYCKNCRGDSGKPYQLQNINPGLYSCMKCNGTYKSSEYREHTGTFAQAQDLDFTDQ